MELLSALEAMEIEQTARDNILYLLDTVVLLFLSLFREAVRFRLFVMRVKVGVR